MTKRVYIFNPFIEGLLNKYDDFEIDGDNDDRVKINVQLLRNTFDNIKYEMIRIHISCDIDELRYIFHTIKQTENIIDKNDHKIIIRSYLNNSNPDCFKISKLFSENNCYYLCIEIYRSDFKEFESVNDVVYLNLSNISFI